MLDIGPRETRDMIYGRLLVGLLGAFAYVVSQRVPLGFDVIRERKPLFRERAGRIENVYRSWTWDERPHRYDLHAEGIPGLDLSTNGPIKAAIGPVVEIPVRPMADESRLESRSKPVTFILIAADDDRLSLREQAASSAHRQEPTPISFPIQAPPGTGSPTSRC